jgi:hypothetical protein
VALATEHRTRHSLEESVVRRRIANQEVMTVAIVVALLSSACGAARIADPSVVRGEPIRTDAVEYHLIRMPGEYRTYVTATYTNRTSQPVYFARCTPADARPMFSVRRTGADSTRTFFTDWAWACVGGVPTGKIDPGASVAVRVPFGSVDQPAMQPPLKAGDLAGTFRIVLSLCRDFVSDSDACAPVGDAERISNAFVVSY